MTNPALRREVINIYKGTWQKHGFKNHELWLQVPVVRTQRHEAYTLSPAELLHLGKEYPLGYSYFQPRLQKAFASKAHLTDETEIRECIKRAEFVKKGIHRSPGHMMVTIVCLE